MPVNWSAVLPLGWSRTRGCGAALLVPCPSLPAPAGGSRLRHSPPGTARPSASPRQPCSYVTARSDGMKKSSYSGEQVAAPRPLPPLRVCTAKRKRLKAPQSTTCRSSSPFKWLSSGGRGCFTVYKQTLLISGEVFKRENKSGREPVPGRAQRWWHRACYSADICASMGLSSSAKRQHEIKTEWWCWV